MTRIDGGWAAVRARSAARCAARSSAWSGRSQVTGGRRRSWPARSRRRRPRSCPSPAGATTRLTGVDGTRSRNASRRGRGTKTARRLGRGPRRAAGARLRAPACSSSRLPSPLPARPSGSPGARCGVCFWVESRARLPRHQPCPHCGRERTAQSAKTSRSAASCSAVRLVKISSPFGPSAKASWTWSTARVRRQHEERRGARGHRVADPVDEAVVDADVGERAGERAGGGADRGAEERHEEDQAEQQAPEPAAEGAGRGGAGAAGGCGASPARAPTRRWRRRGRPAGPRGRGPAGARPPRRRRRRCRTSTP